MSKYDGLIIPRSYSEYINKTDAATLLQALQLSGVMDNAPTASSNHPVKSSGVYNAIGEIISNPNIANCNDMFIKGKIAVYCASKTEVTNLPNINHDWYIIAQCNPTSWSSNNYVTQIATSGGYLNSNDMYIRHGYLSGTTIVWTSWEKVITKNDIVNTVMEYWNIFTSQEITETTATTKNTYASRKFSDYGQLMFILGASGTDYRQTIIIPRSKFSGSAAIVLRAYSGNNYIELFITYNDDTSFKVYKRGTAFAPYLSILGYGGLNI